MAKLDWFLAWKVSFEIVVKLVFNLLYGFHIPSDKIEINKSDSSYYQNTVLLKVNFTVDFNDSCFRINRQDPLWIFIHTFAFKLELH